MKTSFTFISVVFFLLSFIPVKSYCQISIKGQVQEEYGNALPYANVILLTSKDSSLVQGVVVKEGGEFQIDNVHPGSYLLDFSMVGYFPHYTSLQASNTNLQIGLVKLKEDNKQLDEVIVQSQKMLYEQKIDRLVMNVSGSPILTGGTALEVLKRAPGVFVDDANGNITMKGKAGVLVLINGKPTNASLEVVLNRLRGMSSSNIEHIEMLQSPPAEYDAEGNAGAINIILKKNIDQGLNGTVGLSLTYGRFISENGHFDLNWRKGQLNLYGNGSILNGMGHDKYLEHDRSFVLDNINYFSSNIQLIHHNPQRNGNFQLGLDYELSNNTTIGLSGNTGYNVWGINSDSKTISYKGSTLTDSINSKVKSTTFTNFAYGNINLLHRFSPSHEINLDVDYAYYLLSNPGDTENKFSQSKPDILQPTLVEVEKNTPFHIRVGKGDYIWNLPKGQKVKFGLKTSRTTFQNNLQVTNNYHKQESLTTADSEYISEQTNSVYTSVDLFVSPKISLQSGLRYEHNNFQIQASQEENNYIRKNGRLFPSLFLNYKPDSISQFQFSFNRRINRPGYSQLAAYFIYLDPYMVVSGNQKLVPAVTDAVNLTYSWNSIMFTLNYSREKDAIFWRNIVDIEKGLQLNQQHNFDLLKIATFEIALPINPLKWWDIQLSTSINHIVINDVIGREYPVQLQHTQFSGNISQNFSLPWQISLELNNNFLSNYLTGEQARSKRLTMDLGIQKKITKNGGTFSLALIDVFNNASFQDWNFLQEEYSVRTFGIFQFSQRHLRMSYSHPFGNQKMKGARKRSTASEEERNRTN